MFRGTLTSHRTVLQSMHFISKTMNSFGPGIVGNSQADQRDDAIIRQAIGWTRTRLVRECNVINAF